MIVPDRKLSWFRLLFEFRGSALSRILPRLIAVFMVACAVTILDHFGDVLPSLSVIPFTLISLALGVSLGFRNNTSYDRFWEGRRLWGRMVNSARSFARLSLNVIAADVIPGVRADVDEMRRLQRELVYRTIAYVHSVRLHLRDEIHDVSQLAAFLPAEELTQLTVQKNVPLALLQSMSGLVSRARRMGVLHNRDVHLFENMLTDLCDIQGGCERIKSTPIPWSYTLLMHSIVALYCLALPFGLVDTTALATPLVVAMIAYAFLGLDAVGDELEQPFGNDHNDLPLTTISRMIEVNLRQLLGETQLPPLLTPDAQGLLV